MPSLFVVGAKKLQDENKYKIVVQMMEINKMYIEKKHVKNINADWLD